MANITRTLREQWPRLALELVVLVIGITASFLLNEWRLAIGEREEERRALHALRQDLRSDSSHLATRIELDTRMIASYERLLDSTGDVAPAVDSADTYMDHAITYLTFAKRDNTYEELKQTGRTDVIRNEELRGRIINLYNRVYLNATEWDSINRQFVLERMIPYLDDNGPYVESGFAGGVATGLSGLYTALRREDRFRNLIRTNRLFKEAQRAVYELILAEVSAALGAVEAELGGTSRGLP
jgi:hypothetical protein